MDTANTKPLKIWPILVKWNMGANKVKLHIWCAIIISSCTLSNNRTATGYVDCINLVLCCASQVHLKLHLNNAQVSNLVSRQCSQSWIGKRSLFSASRHLQEEKLTQCAIICAALTHFLQLLSGGWMLLFWFKLRWSRNNFWQYSMSRSIPQCTILEFPDTLSQW